jgi:hypothetical protein
MYRQVLILVYDLSEDSTDVPKYVGVVKDRTFQHVSCALSWYGYQGKHVGIPGFWVVKLTAHRCDCEQKALGAQVA